MPKTYFYNAFDKVLVWLQKDIANDTSLTNYCKALCSISSNAWHKKEKKRRKQKEKRTDSTDRKYLFPIM